MKTRTRRLLHKTSLLSLVLGLLIGTICYTLPRNLWSVGGFLVRMEGILLAGIFVELGIFLKLRAALEDSLPGPRRNAFQPSTKEKVWRQAGNMFLVVALGGVAIVFGALPSSPEWALLSELYRGAPGNLDASPARWIMLGITVANALMLIAIHCFTSALAVRFHAESERASGLMTIITGAPAADESLPPPPTED